MHQLMSTMVRGAGSAEKTIKPWIQEHIQCRDCVTFVEAKDSDDPVCGCGVILSKHTDATREAATATATSGPWNSRQHSVLKPTDAFGRLNFSLEDGNQQPDFVRISDDYMEDGKRNIVMKMLEIRWKLPRPHLLISVTGGAKAFNCSHELMARFKKGLVNAAKSTDAWIVTGGTNDGVMKLVGEAVRGTCFGSSIITIGIASWGIVKNRAQLKRGTQKNAKKNVFEYNSKTSTDQGAFLDPNHTHFLLTDNGTQNKYGVEIAFRAAIEKNITEHYRDRVQKHNLPMICILVEGGPNSVAQCLATTKQGNPVLVLEGSGRCADIIAHAHSLSVRKEALIDGKKTVIRQLSEDDQMIVKNKIGATFSHLTSAATEGTFVALIELIRYDSLLTIYSLEETRDFDYAILYSLIRSVTDTSASMWQMMLAITWDRPRIALELIFPKYTFTDDELGKLLKEAVVQNRVEFITRILDQGADMKNFLTHQTLTELYNTMTKKQTIGKRLLRYADSRSNGIITLKLIGDLLEHILEGSYNSTWTSKEFDFAASRHQNFENPYDKMVTYAVLMQYHEMAYLFWMRCNEPIATALIAFKINNYLAEEENRKLDCDEDVEEKLWQDATFFESAASGVMNQCYRLFDKEFWSLILTTPRKSYSNMNIMEIAITTDAKTFIAQGAMQSWLNNVWMGDIHQSTTIEKLCLCWVPPMCFLLRYAKKPMTLKEQKRWEIENGNKLVKRRKTNVLLLKVNPNHGAADIELNTPDDDDDDQSYSGNIPTKRKLNWYEMLVAYYTAPVVKFLLYVLVYFLFLIVYSYTLLVNPKDIGYINSTSRFSPADIVLMLYVLSTLPIEIKQMLDGNPNKLKDKIIYYCKDLFNLLDVLGILTFIVAFILKGGKSERMELIPVQGEFGIGTMYHLLHLIAFVCYALRFIQVLQISENIGPKLIMIRKMMIDLFFFIFLMLIFLITYGICAQALLNPNKRATSRTFFDVLFRPYLHVFGELDLDGMDGDLENGHCSAEALSAETCGIDSVLEDPVGRIHYYLLIAFLAIYLLFVNILLINLLIAIFSNTYEVVQNEASKLWKVQWCMIVREFYQRQPLPNPLSIIWHCVILFKYLAGFCLPSCKGEQAKEIAEIELYKISMIEAEGREEYLLKKEDEDEGGDSKSIKDMRSNLNIIKSLLQDGFNAGQSNMTADSLGVGDEKISDIKNPYTHKDARSNPYIGTTVQRQPIADKQVPWHVSMTDYNPPTYIDEDMLNNSEGIPVDPKSSTTIYEQFNQIAEVNNGNIDRISFTGLYQVIDRIPQNPRGRTGLKGRGCLWRWGPNHTAEPVVTRWLRDPHNERVMIDSQPVLEFVAIFLKDSKKWAIPGGPVGPNEKIIDAIKREFSEDALATLDADPQRRAKIAEMLQEHFDLGIAVYKGYVDDPRNTDNCWIETQAVNYHDAKGTSFSNFPLKASGEAVDVQWIAIDQNIDLYANHEWIIEKVCFHRNAYNPITSQKSKKTVWVQE